MPDDNPSNSPLRVALVGLGTVGSGVARLLLSESERLQRRAGRPIELRKVVVRDASKPLRFEVPSDVVTDDVQAVTSDPEIDVVLQLIGGQDPAFDYMRGFLEAGKHVVTANKALLCERGDELFGIASKAGRCIAFEAAVAGGIPIIAAVASSLTANQIVSIEAILNGTSNFILSEMLRENRSYADALKLAQELGFAEADPTMDVDGTDAAQKLVLLSRLAYGLQPQVSDFLCRGIDTVELVDLAHAEELGYAVKLLATSKLVGDKLEMHVQPSLVPRERLLAQVEGAYNMIDLEGDAVGQTWFSGPGAGQMPTASAVVADLIDIAVGRAQRTFACVTTGDDVTPPELLPRDAVERRYYLRFQVEDRPHTIADVTDVLGRHGISLASVIQKEVPEPEGASDEQHPIVPLVIMTHRTTAGKLSAAASELDQLSCLRAPHIRMPVADR